MTKGGLTRPGNQGPGSTPHHARAADDGVKHTYTHTAKLPPATAHWQGGQTS